MNLNDKFVDGVILNCNLSVSEQSAEMAPN